MSTSMVIKYTHLYLLCDIHQAPVSTNISATRLKAALDLIKLGLVEERGGRYYCTDEGNDLTHKIALEISSFARQKGM